MLYLCNPLTQLNAQGQPALPTGTSFRWISQPPSEGWFKNGKSENCWVFDTGDGSIADPMELDQFEWELAPKIYPNGVPLLDEGVHQNYEIVVDQSAQTQQQAEQILSQLTPLAQSDPLAVKNAMNTVFTPEQIQGVMGAQ